ncbi:MAG: hypothetical protein IIC67_02435 [Thaumarchaeota archaeon]|nr:hypothetical protein [Nitrososphaerota archaeon]
MSLLFEVKTEHLKNLGSERSVGLIRRLVWSDATSSGIGKNLINIPTAITVKDGGIDGEVNGAEKDGKYGIIKKGVTRYQIKSGEFSLTDSNIKSILFKDGTDDLKDRIKSCLDNDGTLVIIFTGWDDPDVIDDNVSNKFREKLQSISDKYKTSKIEVWRQNTIIGFLENFPSLRLYVLGIQDNSFYTHENWSSQSDMRPIMHLGEDQEKFIQDFRNTLRTNDRPVHIRIIGEPGIGKTKLVLKVTSIEDLQPVTIYVEDPTKLEGRDFLNIISGTDDKSDIILVVDECNFTEQTRIWNRLEHKSPNIKLVTIFNEPDDSSGTTLRMDVPELDDKEIGEILHEEYNVEENQLAKWIDFCKPSPRFTHMIGQNLRDNPEDILKPPDSVDIWNRCIAGRLSFDSDEFKNKRTVLIWLSLFKKFGFESPFDKESQKIASLIESSDNIPIGIFTQTVNKLREMKILQGHSTLYITPKILHVYFWTRWWKEYGQNMAPRIDQLIISEEGARDPLNLFKWYCEMFEYAKQSPEASKVVTELLTGKFFEGDAALKSHLGASFFLTLSKTDPSSALSYLERTIGTKSRDELLEFTIGRRSIIWSLERMSAFKEHFGRSASLLLLLAEAENETYSNNATGIFADLFSPAPGRVAPTEVAPKDRIHVLQSAMNSDSKYKRTIGIKACSRALQGGSFSRVVSDYYDINEKPKLWEPKSRDEIIEYYQLMLDLLMDQLEKHSEDQNEVTTVILDNMRHMIIVPDLSERMVKIIRELHEKFHIDDEKLIETVMSVVDFDGEKLDPKVVKSLEKIQKDITGSNFHSLMKRYVGMDLRVDWLLQTKDHDNVREKEIDSLATKAVDAKNLEPELQWLVTNKAKHGYVFGYELAKKDRGYSLLEMILNALRKSKDSSGFFAGGYFRHIFENDVNRWELELDMMYDDPVLCRLLPEITWRSGLTDKSAKRLVNGINDKKFDYTFLVHFKYGGVTNRLSEEAFTEWIEILLEEKEKRAIFLAMDIFHSYFVHRQQKTLPKDLTLRLLLHENIIHKDPKIMYDVMDEYHWKEIGLAFVKQYPDDSIKIVENVIKNFDTENFFGRYGSESTKVLDEIAKIMPRDVWKTVSQYLGPPIDSRAFSIRQWMRGGLFDSKGGILTAIPMSEITSWIDQDKKTRASYIASFFPPVFERVRDFLIRYGDQKEVRRHLLINFSNESWMGSAITHYEKKKKEVEKLKEKETNVNVLSWLNYYIESLDYDIKRSKESEEREF